MHGNAEFSLQNSERRRRRWRLCLHVASCLLTCAWSAEAQIGRTITEVVIEQEGRPISDPLITGLIETHVGSPLAVKDVRETITHIMSLNRFDDVQVSSEESGDGVRVRYVL